jgi:hypothetical protein
MRKTYATVLGILSALFFLRVLGQVLVAFFKVSFLPPMPEWYSGLIPYPVLLPMQLAILLLQARISRDIWFGAGFFARPRPGPGHALCWFAYVYFLVMVVRYGVTMYLYPDRRWFSGTIPIVFHWVLAAYVYLLGRYYRSIGAKRMFGMSG